MAHYLDYIIDIVKNSDVATDSQTAGLATATVAAAAAMHNVAVVVHASYSSSTQSGLLQVKFGTTVKAEKYIHGAGSIEFGVLGYQDPTANEAISAELGAGAGGILGKVELVFYRTGTDS